MTMKQKIQSPLATPKPKEYAALDQRYAERVAISGAVVYSTTDGARIIRVEGALKDLSKTGCKISSYHPPAPGSAVTLHLHLEYGKAPLVLTEASVSWVAGSSFAVQFPKLSADERKRIQEVIWKNATVTALNDRHTAFRIV